MTNEEMEKIIRSVKVGQIWKDTRPPKYGGEVNFMEVTSLMTVPDYAGNLFVQGVKVIYCRNPLKRYITPPKEYIYGKRKFTEYFVLISEKKGEPEELDSDSPLRTDRFDNIID